MSQTRTLGGAFAASLVSRFRVVSLPVQRSAEQVAWAERLAIVDAAEAAALSPPASRMLWETAMGVSNVSAVARHSGMSVPSAHRLRARAFDAVRQTLAEAS